MTRSPTKFASLLTEGVKRVSICERNKTLGAVQDELGWAIKKSGSAIAYWRKGHIPADSQHVEKLAREIVRRSDVRREWLKGFLVSADYPESTNLCGELFPSAWLPGSQSGYSPLPPSAHDMREFAPFVAGLPIMHPRQFFGREWELKRIFGLWARFPLQNIAVIGPQRSGKTSLLHYLKNVTTTPSELLRPGQRSDWLPNPEQYRWILVDFQDTRMCNQERLLRYLVDSLEMPLPADCDLRSFMDAVSEHLETPTLILMDEIGAALASPELDQQFWWSMRALGSNQTRGNLGFLLTSRETPSLLAREFGNPSPFFNIFGHTITLGPFNDDESRQLIASSPQPFEPIDVEWILAQSKRWPPLLQILCNLRLGALESGKADDTWKKEGLREIARYKCLLAEDG